MDEVGSYHTLDLEAHRPFTLTKEEWDIISLERIQMACDVTQKAEIAAVVMQEGLANICLITENMTIIRQRVEGAIPKKRLGSVTNYEKGITRFYDQVYRAMLQHVNFQVVKVLIIASPGFVKVTRIRTLTYRTNFINI
jgi:protein pelota